MPEVRIKAEQRTEFGKGAARRTRRAGKVPAVIYGHGTDPAPRRPPRPRADAGAQDAPTSCCGSTSTAAPTADAAQVGPARPGQQILEHVDLVIVRSGEKVTIDVPVTVHGRVVGALIELVIAALSRSRPRPPTSRARSSSTSTASRSAPWSAPAT